MCRWSSGPSARRAGNQGWLPWTFPRSRKRRGKGAGVRASKPMKQFVRNLRQNQTKAEARIWRHLKNRSLVGFKFRRQCPCGPYIMDFVCFEKMVVIEIDGGQHTNQLQKDFRRTEYLKSRGFNVIRFWNDEVLANTDSVLNAILTVMINSPSSPALLPKGEGNNTVDDAQLEISLSQRERVGVRGKL